MGMYRPCPGHVFSAGETRGRLRITAMRRPGSTVCRIALAAVTLVPLVWVRYALGQAACCDPATGACTQVTTGLCDGVGPGCQSDAECGGGVCVADCPIDTISQPFGTTCTPNCCPQPAYSGADDCDAATVHTIAVPPDPSQAVTVTITGDNSTAATPEQCPPCPSCGPVAAPLWWEAFRIDECANVRIDACCTEPPVYPFFSFNLFASCPCNSYVYASTTDPPVGDSAFPWGQGGPFCEDDNYWATFGPLPAGTYWYPIESSEQGFQGRYQLHITAAACPPYACCLTQSVCLDPGGTPIRGSDGSPLFCPRGDECPPPAICTSDCAELTEFDCDDVRGFSLARNNLPFGKPPVTSCATGRCDIGSCCFGPGACEDRRNPPDPCDPTNPSTCMTRAACDVQSGLFVAGPLCSYPVPPCPFCEFERANNCQPGAKRPPGSMTLGWSGFGTPSDRSKDFISPNGSVMAAADDFIPQESPLRRLCVQGFYIDADPIAQNEDCAELVSDSFLIRVYANDPATNRPGDLVAERVGRIQSKGKEIENILTDRDPVDIWRLQLELTDPQNPATPMPVDLTPGQCYWLEVSNDPSPITAGLGDKCDWYWLTRNSVGNPRDGNDYFATRYEGVGWYTGAVDLAFCLDIDFQPGGCGDVAGACCSGTCAAEGAAATCVERTQLACDASDYRAFWDSASDCADLCPGGTAHGDDCQSLGTTSVCPGPPDNGTCIGGAFDGVPCDEPTDCPGGGCNCNPNGPILVTTTPDPESPAYERLVTTFNTNCATTGGPNPVRTEGQFPGQMADEVWFEYRATCNGRLTVSTCGTLIGANNAGGWDSFIAVYHNPADRTSCACPANPSANSLLWPGSPQGNGFDESCQGFAQAGSGIARGTQPVREGDCFLIRIGGFGFDTGTGVLDISCEEDLCFAFHAGVSPAIVQHDSNPTSTTSLVDLKMNRYLGIQPWPFAAGRPRAISVDFVSLPPPFDIWNGRQLWVQEPISICESSGTDSPGPPCPGGSTATFSRAFLGCAPIYRDWTTVPGGVIYIIHPGIIPRKTISPAVEAEYEIRMIDIVCDPADPLSYSWPVVVFQNKFGDMAGPFDFSGGYYTSPEGNNVGVGTDVTAILNKFSNRPGAPIKPRADLEPCRLDSKINISDVNQALNGFRNLPYPFAPGSGNCPSLDPCAYAAVSQEE